MPENAEPQYTTEEYEFLRKVALSLIEFRALHATSHRAESLSTVLSDLASFIEEGIDEF